MRFIPIEEIRRKSFHMLVLIYIAAYRFLPRPFVIKGLGIFIFIVIVFEILRLNVPRVNKWALSFMGGVHREQETNRISGLIWTVSGSFWTMLLFSNKNIVMVSLLYMAFGDAFAALIGRWIGRIKIFKGKTLEGSLTCFFVCLILGLFFIDWRLAAVGALFATAIELIPWPLNDNFWMPLFSAMFLTFFSKILL